MEQKTKDLLKELQKPIKMERRRKAKVLLKQLVVIAILFVVYTKVFSVHNWMLAVLYSVLSIMLIGFGILVFKFVRYVKANKGK